LRNFEPNTAQIRGNGGKVKQPGASLFTSLVVVGDRKGNPSFGNFNKVIIEELYLCI
jgi:hypothetical protein